MKAIITVEQRHIDAGKPASACSCPIAIACQEQLNQPMLTVGYKDMGWVADKADVEITLPETARFFIRQFDDGQPVEPFSFEVTIG